MTDLAEIGFKADTRGLTMIQRGLRKTAHEGDRTEKSFKKNERAITGSFRAIGAAAAALGITVTAQQIIQYSDAWKQLEGQLRQVVDTETELVRVSNEVANIARDTRSDLIGTAELYAELTRNTRDLGKSSEEVASVTKTINNLFLASSKGAAATAGALRQLNQGLASGVLRGEEFNSVSEGAPRILDAIAQATGIARGELREFAAQGGITADLLFESLSQYESQAQALADATEKTFGQSLTNSSTNLTQFIGNLSNLTGAIGGIGQELEDLTRYLADNTQKFNEWIGILVNAPTLILEAIKLAGDSITSFVDATATAWFALLLEGGEEAKKAFGETFFKGIEEQARAYLKALDDATGRTARLKKAQEDAAKAAGQRTEKDLQAIYTWVKQQERAYQIQQDGAAKIISSLNEQTAALTMTREQIEEAEIAAQLLKENITDEKIVNSVYSALGAYQDLRHELEQDEYIANLAGGFDRVGSVVIDAFGGIVDALDDVQAKMNEVAKAEKKWGKDSQAAIAARNKASISGLRTIAGASKELFEEQSKERKALATLEKALTAVEIALSLKKTAIFAKEAIVRAFSAPFPLNFAAGAAMAAIMASLGFSSGVSGSGPSMEEMQDTQGTGTVLGDAEAKSLSIQKTLERIEDYNLDQYYELRTLNKTMQDLSREIARAAISAYQGAKGAASGIELKNSANNFGVGGIVGGLLGGLFGTKKQEITNSGLQFDNQRLGDVMASGLVDGFYFNVVETTKKKLFGLVKSVKTETVTSAIGDDLGKQIANILGFMGSAVEQAIDTLGVTTQRNVEDFIVRLGSISFEGMTASEIEAELNAIVSQQGDKLVKFAFSYVEKFQQVGEGLFETLMRVTQETVIVNSTLEDLGFKITGISKRLRIDIGQSLIELAGGLDAFQQSTQAYYDNFFTEEEKLADLTQDLGREFRSLGYYLPKSREQFRDIVEGLDLTTQSGQETFATLMKIVPALDSFFNAMEEGAAAAAAAQRQLEQQRATVYRSIVSEVNTRYDDEIANIRKAMAAEQNASRARVAAINSQKGIAERSVANLRRMADKLNNAIFAIGQTVEEITLADRRQAMQQVSAALAAAQGGDLSVIDSLDDALSVLQQDSADLYATEIDMLRDARRSQAELRQISDLTGEQLSIEERTLAAIERSAAAVEAGSAAAQARMQKMIDELEEQREAELEALKTAYELEALSLDALNQIAGNTANLGAVLAEVANNTRAQAQAAQEAAQVSNETAKKQDAMIEETKKLQEQTHYALNSIAKHTATTARQTEYIYRDGIYVNGENP